MVGQDGVAVGVEIERDLVCHTSCNCLQTVLNSPPRGENSSTAPLIWSVCECE